MNKDFIVDRQGRQFVLYAGLLDLAHQQGLKAITTTIVQIPVDENGTTAIVHATVETERGVFTGIGDAAPHNVSRMMVPHLLRMAETRAKARALRDAVNIGVVSLEELGDLDGDTVPEPPAAPRAANNVRPLRPAPARPVETPTPTPRPVADHPVANGMTEAQRRLLFRLLAEQGYEGEAAKDALCEAAGVASPREVTKAQASSLIDAWRDEGVRRA